MFASWKKAGNASLVAAAAVAGLLLAARPAQALEGVQGHHAIFYPSLELVYQHDDNYFLSPGSTCGFPPTQSADTFLAHAHFPVEVPGARQYLRFEYQPQYRNVNLSGPGSYSPPDNVSHFWDLQAKLRGSSVFGVDIRQHASLGNLETYELDPARGELNIRAGDRFFQHEIGVNFNWEGSHQGAILKTGHFDTNFTGSHVTLNWFEINDLRLGMEYFYKFTPLSRFFLGYDFRDAREDFTQPGIPRLTSNENDLNVGFQGELGRTTTGRASIGYADLSFNGATISQSDFAGIRMTADVTKSFSRYSKLIFGVERAPNYSAFGSNTHYIDNRVAFTFSNQPQGHRVGWTLAGSYQRDDYDHPEVEACNPLVSATRQDDIRMARAEVGYHVLEHLSLRLNYRYEQRQSNFHEFEYTDNLVIFQLQFGF